jgi:transposase InsO family protein
VPEVLVPDNGPHFGSADFRAFARHLAVFHVTSSPFDPESNGLAERSVQTVKAAFIKSMEDGRTLQDTLRAIRSTPVGGGLPSPSVLLQSRNLRGSLPFLSEFLRHQNVSSGAVAAELKRRQVSAAFHKKAARPSRYSILTIG